MQNWQISLIFLYPTLVLLHMLILKPATWLVTRFMKEGKIKRFMLIRWG